MLRSQSNAEYLTEHQGSAQATENVIGRILSPSRVPFKKLCDPKRNRGDSETVHGVIWKVFTTERGFDDLFWTYWTDIGEQWRQWMKGEKPRTRWMKRDAVTFWKLAYNKEKYPGGFEQLWKERGQSMLDSWKRDGVPANDFSPFRSFAENTTSVRQISSRSRNGRIGAQLLRAGLGHGSTEHADGTAGRAAGTVGKKLGIIEPNEAGRC